METASHEASGRRCEISNEVGRSQPQVMPATDSEPASMEDQHAVQDDEGSLMNVPSSGPPPCPTASVVSEDKPVPSAADLSSPLSPSVDASPAKPVVASPTTIKGTVETSLDSSQAVSASDSPPQTGTSLVSISEPPLHNSPSTVFGSPDQENGFPSALTYKGVTVTLENSSVWEKFNSCGTEMILTKQGRRMFPYCRYRFTGLDPDRLYSLVLSIVPSDQHRYRWNTLKWEVSGPAEYYTPNVIRAFSHHHSPSPGSQWMSGLVSFYKLKLTNNPHDTGDHIILHSMHRYVPRLHVIPAPDGVAASPDRPLVVGPESMTFTFPQTEFMAVTTYQNFRITQLKIHHNPFARGFREDGNNFRLHRVTAESPLIKTETPEGGREIKEEDVDLSLNTQNANVSPSSERETRLVLKPIMFSPVGKDEPFARYARGGKAFGDLVLVQKQPLVEPKQEPHEEGVSPSKQRCVQETPKAMCTSPESPASTPRSSPGRRKRGRTVKKHESNFQGGEWKAAAASTPVGDSPSLTVAMQPEQDDVEGLLFVSFTTKEALDIHVKVKPPSIPSSPSPPSSPSSPVSPVPFTTPEQLKETEFVTPPETDEDKISRLEAVLLKDLKVLKHRQVIHSVLQEVGLKLSSLDQTKSVDLLYLGVHLPLPPLSSPEQSSEATAESPGNEGLPFISRTGKTSDMTKIKGWKDKFIKTKETSPPNCDDGSQKNLSAFCSNMLDEYLESEAQQISERAAAFFTNPEGSVTYQLPAKSSSYVKTLDSALKHREAASKAAVVANRPCPLSHKALLYSALTSPAPPLAGQSTPVQPVQQSTPSPTKLLLEDDAKAASKSSSKSSASPRLSTHVSGGSQIPAVSQRQSQALTHKPTSLTKSELRLLEMEIGSMNQGLKREQLTPDRLTVALSVLLTKEMLHSQSLKVPQYPEQDAAGPRCGQEFCRLGCVCSSLYSPRVGPFHCRRPECMLGCTCFKHRIAKQLFSMINMENIASPHQAVRSNKLWNRSVLDVDQTPLCDPKISLSVKDPKHSSASRINEQDREEEKNQVYRYFESLETCARVRRFKSKPPPEVTPEPIATKTPAPVTPEKKKTEDKPKVYYRTIRTAERDEDAVPDETHARKQIEIQSGCQWDKDRKTVLEGLFRRLNQNRLTKRFRIGRYRIHPVTRIFMQKPSGSLITYRVNISKQANSDEEDLEAVDEEKKANQIFHWDSDAEEEDEEPEPQRGITPFLCGVSPAGVLQAKTKPAGSPALGLIQVNGKSYNQARLLLGGVGSLHPANRLAAYVTGRLLVPGDLSRDRVTNNPDPRQKVNRSPAGKAVVPPTIPTSPTEILKKHPLVQSLKPVPSQKRSVPLPQPSQSPSAISLIEKFVLSQCSQGNILPKSSKSSPVSLGVSPVSLTVSPSLKTPSFLRQSGTYSFRICPPANQSAGDGVKLPGVTLPGGFTLIQLPKPGDDAALAPQSATLSTTNMAVVCKAEPQNDPLFPFDHWTADSDGNQLGLDIGNGATDLSKGRSAAPDSQLGCDAKMKSEASEESMTMESSLYSASEDDSSDSDSSDYCLDDDEETVDIETVDSETVDIETVDEAEDRVDFTRLMTTAINSDDSRISVDDFGSPFQDQSDGKPGKCHVRRKRLNHTAIERRRRNTQRALFDKLQAVLGTDPKTPRLRLLLMALHEIHNQTNISKHLTEKKKQLAQQQSLYVQQLSRLSGKSDRLLELELKNIFEKQRDIERAMNWKSSFSNLLHCKAAVGQATTRPPRLTQPLLQPDVPPAPFQAKPHTTAAKNNVNSFRSLLERNEGWALAQSTVNTMPDLLPQAVTARAQKEVPSPPLREENQPGELVSSVQLNQPPSELEKHPEAPGDPPDSQTDNQSEAQPFAGTPADSSSAPPAPRVLLPQPPIALPLIRSKTGRIILPSSLKPPGQGFYTILFNNPSQNKDRPLSEGVSDSESSRALEDDNLSSLDYTNTPIRVPSVNLQPLESPERGTEGGLNTNLATACLSYNLTSMEPNRKPIMVVRRGRGRPRKNPPDNAGPQGTDGANTPGVLGNGVPVKRARGRPPKKGNLRNARQHSPDEFEDGIFARLTRHLNKCEMSSAAGEFSTSRPLTRGALGKDFPSAKKRSWIDVEKELEPELDSE